MTVRLVDGTLTVDDQGPGIAEVDRPHVFDRFYRSQESRGMSGSGLGLSIVRQVAERHSGTVEADDARRRRAAHPLAARRAGARGRPGPRGRTAFSRRARLPLCLGRGISRRLGLAVRRRQHPARSGRCVDRAGLQDVP